MIKCPNCGSPKTMVRDVKSIDGRARRTRVCKNCANSFTTFEVLAVYAGRSRGMVLDMFDMDQELQQEMVNTPPTEVNG